jgi:DNA-directed RNA polymerase specialized sigma24 family protein
MAKLVSDNDLEKYLKASLLIQLKTLPDTEKPELLLAEAGFSPAEVAAILKKNYGAVSKAIERARKSKQ